MTKNVVDGGVVHDVPEDLFIALNSDKKILNHWNNLTPLARNEWICWVITNKKPETRSNHLKRISIELNEGKRRPCCWAGCPHRSDRVVKKYTKGYKAKTNE
jgi:hypothetical protein